MNAIWHEKIRQAVPSWSGVDDIVLPLTIAAVVIPCQRPGYAAVATATGLS